MPVLNSLNKYMPRLFKLNEINSNWIFIFPVVSGFLKGYMVYSFLSFCIFIASFCFHLYKYAHSNGRHINYIRSLDAFIATACYLYMFYFVKTLFVHNQSYFYILLTATVFLFFFGKTKFGVRYNVHSYFHLAIGMVAGCIPLFV